MNLPNKLTVARVLLIPVFIVFFVVEAIPMHYLWALIIFVAASLTDLLDGQIARKRNLITDFGKLMDPLADKLLVMSAIILLVPAGMVEPVLVIVILGREFLVSAIRQIAAANGTVLAADNWGKLKTVSQMVWISVDLLLLYIRESGSLPLLYFPLEIVHMVLLGSVMVFTIFSGINYLWANRHLFKDM